MTPDYVKLSWSSAQTLILETGLIAKSDLSGAAKCDQIKKIYHILFSSHLKVELGSNFCPTKQHF
jgi:hypothetical protein